MQIKSDIQVFFFYANWRIVDYKINNNSFVQVELWCAARLDSWSCAIFVVGYINDLPCCPMFFVIFVLMTQYCL